MKKKRWVKRLLCVILMIGLLLPVSSPAMGTELITGENETDVIEVSSVEELLEKCDTEYDAEKKQVTVTIPIGTTVYVTKYLLFQRSSINNYETVVLTGGGTLVPRMDDITLSMIYASADLVLDNVVVDGQGQLFYSSVVCGENGAEITMKGGKICNFKAQAKAVSWKKLSAVSVNNSDFIMQGGTIENMDMDAVLMAEGTGNSVNGEIISSVRIDGGTIRSNNSTYGTVTLFYYTDFTMNGGTICNNTAQYGGAVFSSVHFSNTNQINLLGGSVYGNTAKKQGDGIYFAYGKPIVISRDCDFQDEIYFGSASVENAYLLLTDGLSRYIHVRYYDSSSYLYDGRLVAQGCGGYAATEEDAVHIQVNNEGYVPARETGNPPQENIIKLDEQEYTITFMINGQVVSRRRQAYGTRPSYGGDTSRPADEEYVYDFIGWRDSDGVFFDGLLAVARRDTTYTAVYDQVSHRDNFISALERIGRDPLEYSVLTGKQLAEANEAYGMLSEEAREDAQVQEDYEMLQSCQRVWEVLKLIDALPEEITLLQRTVITEAREAYDALSAREKAMLADGDNFGVSYQKLLEAERDFEALARIQNLLTFRSSYTVYVNGSPVNLGAWTDGDSKQFVYISSDPSVVSVDKKGYLTALRGGTVTVTIQAPATEKFDASNVVTVTVQAEKDTQEIRCYAKYQGRNFSLYASSDGEGMVSYESLAPEMAKVDSRGNVTSLGVGTAVIRVKAAETEKYKAAYKDFTFDIVAVYGAAYTVDGVKYKVTDANIGGDGTVRVEGLAKSVKKAVIPDTVRIGNHTYRVTAIRDKAFKNNQKLTQVEIGKNVTSIGKQAFYGCKNLSRIIIQSAKLKKVGGNALKGTKKKAAIRVPRKKLSAYKKLLKGKGLGKKSVIKAL